MIEHWLEITQGGRLQRHSLGAAGSSVGGGDALVPLEGVGKDQLKLVPGPWRVTFHGSGPPPFCGGQPLAEAELEPGLRIEWAGILIEYRVQAKLQELESSSPKPAASQAPAGTGLRSGLTSQEEQAWLRVRAGLLVDTGQVDRGVVKHWQRAVMEGEFDVADCCAELNAAASEVGSPVVERSGRLMRDFLMSSKLKGASGAARASRKAARSLLGMLLAQFIAISAYSLIVIGCMIFIRNNGYSFDGLFDSVLGAFGLK